MKKAVIAATLCLLFGLGVGAVLGHWRAMLPEKQIAEARQDGYAAGYDIALSMWLYCGPLYRAKPLRDDLSMNYWACWKRTEIEGSRRAMTMTPDGPYAVINPDNPVEAK